MHVPTVAIMTCQVGAGNAMGRYNATGCMRHGPAALHEVHGLSVIEATADVPHGVNGLHQIPDITPRGFMVKDGYV